MAKNEGNDLGGGARNYVKFTGIAFQMIIIIGVMTFAGYKIDESARHDPMWVTAIMSLAGVLISLYLIIRSLKN
ncbi:AtpZ/AtpI family protein [Mucilaginibacter myungsuensis]|uniref:AtpZ/AtpI family protein n=1 Tax=Mucilaginibacter myungsuensis TaxID=649104 RepID=A0A929PYZ3_9SPHI|nr:AtpZ/AtpI family protein [Mucilaginibacter myungsuensis]MBE9663965.1 AtpZ/AtpI family protein [Mucilaginibacter myungsuensis]MDN3598319.1 AtpZ/AtpI family protein [Mucilaginibacter myungsuensis]